MKKTFRLLLSLALFVAMIPMTSCSDDKEDDMGKVEDIYGTWVMNNTTNKEVGVFNFEKGSEGYVQLNAENNDGTVDTQTVRFSYTAEPWDTGRVKVTINYIETELDSKVIYVKVDGSKMVVDGRENYTRAEINKNFVGKWETSGIDGNISYTMLFEFKSNGKGEVTLTDTDTTTQQTVTNSKSFTWSVAGFDGTMLMIRVDEGTAENPGNIRVHDVMLTDGKLILDGDTYIKK